MTVALIVLAAIVVIVVVVGLALAPALNKKGDAATALAKELVGGEANMIEPKAVGMGTEPSEAGGLLGLGCLAASDSTIAFVTFAPQEEFTIDRSKVTRVDVAAEDPTAVAKSTIEVFYRGDGGEEVVARWRFGRDLVEWLDELDYDWGPGGPPSSESEESDSTDSEAQSSTDATDSADGSTAGGSTDLTDSGSSGGSGDG